MKMQRVEHASATSFAVQLGVQPSASVQLVGATADDP
jgi:hypothetical protein